MYVAIKPIFQQKAMKTFPYFDSPVSLGRIVLHIPLILHLNPDRNDNMK